MKYIFHSNVMLGIWHDDTPDNNVVIDLVNGTITGK